MNTACETYRDDLAAEACGALPEDESRALARHVTACPACRAALERLRKALTPLDTYTPEPPARLIELTQRRVARQMIMRLPTASRWSRPRLVRTVAAAVAVLAFGTMFLVPVLQPAFRETSSSPRDRQAAQLQGIWSALGEYAAANQDYLPPSQGWFEALNRFEKGDGQGLRTAYAPFGRRRWSDEFIFMEGLSKWTLGLGPGDRVLLVERRPGPDNRHQALLRDGRVELLTETDARRLFQEHPATRAGGS